MTVTEIRTLHNGAKIYECASSDIGSLPAAPVDSCAVVTDSPGLLMIVDASGDWQQAPQTSRDFAGAPGRVGTLASVDAVRTCQQKANALRANLTLYVGAPIQQAGTVSVSGATVTGVGTAFETWFPSGSGWLGIAHNAGTEEEPDWGTDWALVDSVTSDTELVLSNTDYDGYEGIPSLSGGGSDSNSGTSPDAPLATWAAVSARLSAIDVFLGEGIRIIVLAPAIGDEIGVLVFPASANVAVSGNVLPSLRVYLNGGMANIRCTISFGLYAIAPGYVDFEAETVLGEIKAAGGALVSAYAGTLFGVTANYGGTIHLRNDPGEATLTASGGVIMYPGVYGTPPTP